jgi:F-type H+-transporting ATPase subunit gamma
MRITGTTNIAKITKSMKMVSAAKLRGDQQRLAAAKPFAVSLTTPHSALNIDSDLQIAIPCGALSTS